MVATTVTVAVISSAVTVTVTVATHASKGAYAFGVRTRVVLARFHALSA